MAEKLKNLTSPSVATRIKKEAISVVILAALPAAVETMSCYYSPGEPRLTLSMTIL